MPELPEVETVVRTLRPVLVGRVLQGVRQGKHHLRTPWQSAWNRLIPGCSIIDLTRRGKWILMELSRPQYRLIVHLGMTGRLLVQENSVAPTKHTHLVFPLKEKNEELRFHDPRRFGCVTVAKQAGSVRFAEEAELGPEPFNLTLAGFSESLMKSRRKVKAILLDQSVVAGVGNIYADESLYESRIHPKRLGTSLSKGEISSLRKSIVKVLRRAIESKGSTIANFYYGNDETGSFQNEFKAYGRTDEPCKRCRKLISCIRLGGRSTHFCSVCQR
ncbi:MAG TPA: bifunctional DNA-formamidopyrimidine glycosylase/DNA-(apurinic or apyrimidinic site) lyase [Gemmatales bacterium]|nr:bifunctional DNA-formamidopyrimidine glycosylase/DNA-(apurinic or apyrimidinic site) lyase [Gemmatales bacterium]